MCKHWSQQKRRLNPLSGKQANLSPGQGTSQGRNDPAAAKTAEFQPGFSLFQSLSQIAKIFRNAEYAEKNKVQHYA